MTWVKPYFPPGERTLSMMLGLLAQDMRSAFTGPEWQGLRLSHIRVMSGVPTDGITITELAERVVMTKQGCGQFVAQLCETGHLELRPNPRDRRSRIVLRTTLGRRTMRRATTLMAQVERGWAGQVGPERYAEFRAVLEELVFGDG
jgi:DNA-binding MarR family transcriptional regulator